MSRHAALIAGLVACGCDAPASEPDDGRLASALAAPAAVVESRATLTHGLPPGAAGTLLFHSDREGRNHVYRLDLATGALTALTEGAGHNDEGPAPAPDGRRVAFSTTRFDHRTFDLAVMNADGTAVQQVTTDLAFEQHPVWGADGQHLFFTGEHGGTQALFRIALDGGAITRVSPPPDRALMPRASPDGRNVAYVVGTTAGLRVVVQDLSTGELRPVTPEGQDVSEPDWSADGARLAFARIWPDGSAIEILTLATGQVARLRVDGLAALDEPAWSPDGRWIAAVGSEAAGADADWDVLLLRADGGAAYRVTDGGAHDHAPAWLQP